MKQHLKTGVGIALSVLLLAWTMRDVSLAEVLRELGHADLPLLAASILLALVMFAMRAVRWGICLVPLGQRVPFRPRFAAIMVGFAANNLLPARVGEFARALALSRTTRVPTAAAFATLVVERIFDAIVLLAFLFAAMASPRFPLADTVAGIDPQAAAQVVALGLIAMCAVLFGMAVAPEWSLRLAEGVAGRLVPQRFRASLLAGFASFLHGLAVLRSAPLFLASLLLSLAQWTVGAWSFLLGFWAFGIEEVPFVGAVFLQSLVSLSVAVPSSPGFFGPFEAATRVGLKLWDVAADKAVSFAVGFHIAGFIPVTLIGLYYVWRMNLRWREVKHSDEVVEERLEDAPAAAGRERP